MNDRILVPLDDSEPARSALSEAFELFPSATIVVLNVIDPSEFNSGVQGNLAGSVYEAKQELAEDLFAEARTAASEHDVSIETVLETGDPVDLILDVAETEDIDHIVMGSHGRSGLSRIIVGSVAEAVIREAPVSVTVSRRNPSTESE